MKHEYRKILIIEDDEADQYIARYILGRHWPDSIILTAVDGEEALGVLERNIASLPDLIFLDINMPRMNGHEFLHAWYRDRGYDLPALVMLTSSASPVDREQVSKYECVRDYLIKPLDKHHLERLATALPAA